MLIYACLINLFENWMDNKYMTINEELNKE